MPTPSSPRTRDQVRADVARLSQLRKQVTAECRRNAQLKRDPRPAPPPGIVPYSTSPYNFGKPTYDAQARYFLCMYDLVVNKQDYCEYPRSLLQRIAVYFANAKDPGLVAHFEDHRYLARHELQRRKSELRDAWWGRRAFEFATSDDIPKPANLSVEDRDLACHGLVRALWWYRITGGSSGGVPYKELLHTAYVRGDRPWMQAAIWFFKGRRLTATETIQHVGLLAIDAASCAAAWVDQGCTPAQWVGLSDQDWEWLRARYGKTHANVEVQYGRLAERVAKQYIDSLKSKPKTKTNPDPQE